MKLSLNTKLQHLALAATLLASLLLPATASAAPPAISGSAVKGATTTTATLGAAVDPLSSKSFAHFEYVTQTAFDQEGFAGAASTPEIELPGKVTSKGDLTKASSVITGVAVPASGAFGPGQVLTATGLPSGTTIKAVSSEAGGLLRIEVSAQATETKPQITLSATGPEPITAQISDLTPGSAYRFRAVAKNSKAEEATGPDAPFYTLAPPPTYGPCPNQAFRTGELSPLDTPGALLSDCRSYEQASPVDKNGNNALNLPSFTRAAAQGGAITFGATFGLPGGQGAQVFPFYLASRGQEAWTTSGLQPPASLGEQARPLIGWLPDFQATYAQAEHLGDRPATALYELHPDGSAPTQIVPYTELPETVNTKERTPYGFAGASADASTVVIEASTALAPKEGQPPITAAVPDAPNVYAWDRATGELHLASAMNSEAETEAALTKGAFPGPYNWALPSQGLRTGGPSEGYYVREQRAVSSDGSVFFTSAADGHLYQRLNPTAPQSAMAGGQCTEPEKACTIDVSVSRKTNGQGPGGSDPAGPAPAAFMAASADGRTAFFTSSQKLTNDADTGPEVAAPQIGTAEVGDPEASKDESFLHTHALGTAVDAAGEYLYWAEPLKGTIARAKLNPDGSHGPADESFVDPGDTEAVTFPLSEPGVLHSAPSRPRYVAVGPCAGGGECVYWTNTGPAAGEETSTNRLGGSLEGGGTIGRARIEAGAATDVEPEFITGASNPQGIAVNSEHVYWANAGPFAGFPGGFKGAIGRASIAGGGAEQEFIKSPLGWPWGMALDSTNVYFSITDEAGGGGFNGYLARANLAGGKPIWNFVGKEVIRGIATDSEHVYWASQDKDAIGRSDLEFEGIEGEFVKLGGQPIGLTLAGSHLYFSTNGESPPNPGNDLYRFDAGDPEPLQDLTSDPVGNGAEVQGVLGTSEDGAYVYFAANGDLDGSGRAQRGDCTTTPPGNILLTAAGECSIYLYHEGEITFVAPVDLGDAADREAEGLEWAPMLFLGISKSPMQKLALTSADGKALLFISRLDLTGYESHGAQELYRYHYGDAQPLRCLSCPPSGATPSGRVSFGSNSFPQIPREEGISAVSVRFLAAEGNRAFFESTEALVSGDTNGKEGCPPAGRVPRCLDVYEWEAPGTGTCTEGGPGWSVQDRGCLYLISTGRSPSPSIFADASASGEDAYFFTDQQLVRGDTDSLFDVYDARVGGGLASQNPANQPPCEGDPCKGPATPPPPVTAPPAFSGPPNPTPKRCKGKRCKKKHHKHKKHRHLQNQRHGGKK